MPKTVRMNHCSGVADQSPRKDRLEECFRRIKGEESNETK